MQGYSLIEVLISIVLFTGSLIVIAATEVTITKQLQQADFFTLANLQLNNAVEELSFTPSSQISQIQSQWNEQNSLLLPQGRGKFWISESLCTLELSWLAQLDVAKPPQKYSLQRRVICNAFQGI